MEKVAQALERAKADIGSSKFPLVSNQPHSTGSQRGVVELSSAALLSRRIVAHNGADYRSRPYEMLRTQIMQAMDQHGWKILGVTSPTPGCGKTVTALNLAFSIARLENRSVLLIDLDLRKPQLANYLGVKLDGRGVLDVLDGRTPLGQAVIAVSATSQRIAVLPTTSARDSAETMGSRAMQALLQDLKREYPVILLDLPPLLASGDVLSILPQIDCAVLVTAIGQSKPSEIEESIRHLDSTPLVRLVANKATDETARYYY